ncbi:HAMP domain-containing sensor histidine kinase [Herbidospora mongoliensis]|uniref:HAMP domain-containing sensor histidine kinase n=1 Tax=Herbidospora mongoliensis TaxID=688067 RepID=UPI000A0542E8|nr:HAMP domain-containing sensor histidine kinase [Herbidospora mongoliensis]
MTPEGTPLRQRALAAILGVTALAVVLFAVPLAVLTNDRYHDRTASELARSASRHAAALRDDPTALPQADDDDILIGIYTKEGKLQAGAGPATSAVAALTRDGLPHQGEEGPDYAAAAPIPSGTGVVRVATPYEEITEEVYEAWQLIAILAVVALGVGAAVAIYLSRRLAIPLERLTGAAQALGDGDFTVRAPKSGVLEVDQAGEALAATARRLGEVLARERAFSGEVSHQLRTGVTGLMLGLESAVDRPSPEKIASALARAERLQTIIEDLVTLSRDTGRAPLDLPVLLAEIRADWEVTIRVDDDLPEVTFSTAAVRQILLVLLDNARRHGAGEITLTVADIGAGISIDVSDQGEGVTEERDVFGRIPRDGHGIGLGLARSLAEAEGGRLILRRERPPTFSLLLPSR